MYHEFTIPDDEEIFEVTGEWPEVDDEGVRSVAWRVESGESITLSYGFLTRSVRLLWSNRDGQELLDTYREGATNLKVSSSPQVTHVSIEFNTGECAGATIVQVAPFFSVKDRLLFV